LPPTAQVFQASWERVRLGRGGVKITETHDGWSMSIQRPYSVYYGEAKTEVPPDASRFTVASFHNMETALAFACSILRRHKIVWQVNGPQNFHMGRKEIEAHCRWKAARKTPRNTGTT
jgi:hypothetical protein